MGVIERFIEQSNAATSQEQVFRHLCDALLPFGYDTVVYTLLTDHPSIQRKAQHGVMSSYPADWLKYYAEHNYGQYDPVRSTVYRTKAPYTWKSLTDDPRLPKMARRVMDESAEARLLDGAATPIYGPNFEIAGVGIASTTGGINPDKNFLSVFRALTNQFHIVYSALDPNFTDQQAGCVELTEREKEILLWSAEGKSVPAIAIILGTSDDNVKYHLKKIYKKLDVADRLQAVVKAIFSGIIYPSNVRRLQLLPG